MKGRRRKAMKITRNKHLKDSKQDVVEWRKVPDRKTTYT